MSGHHQTQKYSVGATAQLSRTIVEEDLEKMAHLTGDTNPIHFDEAFALKSRFKGRIAHGLFASGLISAVLGTELPGPGAVYLTQSMKFLYPVRIQDTITAIVEVLDWRPEKGIVSLRTYCENQDGVMVVDGEAALLIESF